MAKHVMTYDDAGVDINAGQEVVDRIKSHMRGTYGPRVLDRHGGFAGCFRLDYNEKLFKRNFRDPVLVSCTDSVGSKVLLASQMGVFDTIGQDVVAMNVNDLIVQGADPLFFLDYIGIHKIEPVVAEQIVRGVADGCNLADCALLGGETAELPDLYKPGEFDLAGFAVGVCELSRMIHGERAEAGDVILALASSGIHSNGYALVRAIVRDAKLHLDKKYPELDDSRSLGQVLLTPTRIYARSIVKVLRRYRVKKPVAAMSHITGGGLPGNLPRTLDSNLDARIDPKSWQVPPVFQFLQQRGNVADEEMLKVFNMGIGYVMVVRPHFADSIASQLRQAGEQVFILGQVVRGSGKVVLS